MIEQGIYGELRVVSIGETDSAGQRMAACVCSCGAACIVREHHLKAGHTTSCGCVKQENYTEHKTESKYVHNFLYGRGWAAVHDRLPTKFERRAVAKLYQEDPDTFWRMVEGRADYGSPEGKLVPSTAGQVPPPRATADMSMKELMDRSLNAERYPPRRGEY